jgi:hypothetical protein
MTIDLITVRVVLLIAAAILFFTGAGLGGADHSRKTLIVWGVGLGLIAVDRLIELVVRTSWPDSRG